MSSGSYDIPHISSAFSRYEPRRSSGSFPAIYDRLPPIAPRRSPSPSPSRRTYDSYVPPRPAVSYREDHPNSYRPPNIYRPEYPSNNLYSRSPSPDRYVTPTHSVDSDIWDRQTSWQSSYPKPVGWQERKPAPPSPTASARSRGQRDDTLATRMFEPSENWKQTHTDRPGRSDGPERYPDSISRAVQDLPSDSLSRSASRSSVPLGGDRYRPAPKSHSVSNTRSEYDSYRPSHDNEREYRDSHYSVSRPSSSFRRDPPLYSNPWDPSASGDQHASRLSSRAGSPDWRPSDYIALSPIPSDLGGRRYDPDARTARMELSRRSSRSSIASTHVSDLPLPAIKGLIPTNSVDSSSHSQHTSDSPPLSSRSSPRPNSAPANISLANASKPTAEKPTEAEPPSTVHSKDRQLTANGRIAGLDAFYPLPEQKPPTIGKSISGTSQAAETLAEAIKGHSTTQGELPDRISTPATPSSETLPQASSHNFTPPKLASEIANSLHESTKPRALSIDRVKSTLPTRPLLETQVENTASLQDNSKILLQLKPLFPPEMPPSFETPSILNALSLPEALRAVVMTRLMFDRQLRDDFVNPVLMANQETAAKTHIFPTTEGTTHWTPDSLIGEVLASERRRAHLEVFKSAQPSLAEHFELRQVLVSEKIQRLSTEYLALHEKWRAHCSALSDHTRSILSSEHEGLQLSGRTTRRTTAITDAVRSDLEMEQIIASLGNDDAMDPNYMSMRNAATIPDMISVTHGQVDYVFDDTNHLVENPSEYFAPDTGIDDWTAEEKRVFIDRFAQFPKQFGVIAELLPHKTASQCVDYYYLHKKRQIDFRKVVAQLGPKKKKRRGGGKKKGNALLADIAQHDAEVGKNLSSFVVPSRVGKGRRGPGRPPKVHNSSTPVAGSDKGPGHSATATPQPEQRSARLSSQFLDPLTNPATPEPEGRLRRRKPATPGTAPVPLSAPLSVSVTSASASVPPPAPEAESDVMDISEAMSTAAQCSVPAATPVRAPTPPPMYFTIVPPPPPPPPLPVAPTPSESSTHTKIEEDDATPDLDSRPVKRPKRGRKQVKSVAIIHEEPPSPPPESALGTPVETLSGQPEPSSVLTKATKILSDFEARRQNGHHGNADKASPTLVTAETANPAATSSDAELELDGNLPDAEKSLFLDALTYYGVDFKLIATEMPGRSVEELENFYRLNESKLNVNDLRRKQLGISQEDELDYPSPPMASLVNSEARNGVYHHPVRGPYPNHPSAIPFRPHFRAGPSHGDSNAAGYQRGEPPSYVHHPYMGAAPYGYHYLPQHHYPPGVYSHHPQEDMYGGVRPPGGRRVDLPGYFVASAAPRESQRTNPPYPNHPGVSSTAPQWD